MSETKIITPIQRATRMKQLAEKVKELQQFANENQIQLFIEAGAIVLDGDDADSLRWNRVTTSVSDTLDETIKAVTDSVFANADVDEDERERVGEFIERRMVNAAKAIRACDAITGLRELEVPSELVGRLLHEPLVELTHRLTVGYALQASVKDDNHNLQRVAGDDARLLTKVALIKAGLPERQRNSLLLADYEDNTAIGFLTALQHMAEEMRDNAERVENSAREEGLV